jgi:hypothetical protein
MNKGFKFYFGTIRNGKPVIQIKTKDSPNWHILEKDFKSVAECKRRLAELDKLQDWIDLYDTKNGLKDPEEINTAEAIWIDRPLNPLPEAFRSNTFYPVETSINLANAGLKPEAFPGDPAQFPVRPLIDDTQEDINEIINPPWRQVPHILNSYDPDFLDVATHLVQTRPIYPGAKIQIYLKTGFNRAGEIIQQLEELEIIRMTPDRRAEYLVADTKQLNNLFIKYGLI